MEGRFALLLLIAGASPSGGGAAGLNDDENLEPVGVCYLARVFCADGSGVQTLFGTKVKVLLNGARRYQTLYLHKRSSVWVDQILSLLLVGSEMNEATFSFSDRNLKSKVASNLSISTLGKSIERVDLETTTSSLTSRLEGTSGPLVVSQVASNSAHVEVIDQSLDDLEVETGVESAMESLETYTGGLWIPEVKGDFGAFKAHVLAQESVAEHVRLVSLASKSDGFSSSLRKRLRNLQKKFSNFL